MLVIQRNKHTQKAVIQMKNKRIEVTAQEREALKRMKTRAQYATSEFEDMS